MCGACGASVTGWTERIAPLDARAALGRSRALSALLREAPTLGARRLAVAPWPGGGWRLTGPSGVRFVPSLTAVLTEITARYGPLVPRDGTGETEVTVRARVGRDALAVWCATLVAASPPGEVRVEAGEGYVLVGPEGVDLHVPKGGFPPPERVSATSGAQGLARSLSRLAMP